MNPTRRNLLALGGGGVAGLVFTPVPWKLLDDSAIWTQNWPWIPQPVKAPVEAKAAVCGLCPNGCALSVRMAAGAPVGISPARGGAICPLGFGAHQLNWHPARLRTPLHRGRPATWEEASSALAKAKSEGPVMVVDGQPGRAVSTLLQKAGEYVIAASPEERALSPYAEWTGAAQSTLGYDLESVRTIVSFGAPLLDGWGAPGRFAKMWSARAAGTGDPDLRVIQIEPALSHTASCSWRWVSLWPGTDAALAAGIARVLIEQNLVAAKGPMPALSLEDAASQSGIPADAIVELARTISAHLPALAISADRQPAVAALNVLIGGPVVQRRETVVPAAKVPAPRAVVIDATVPWDYAPPAGVETFRFAAWNGGGISADWLLPAPGFLEEMTDHSSPPASATASWALSPALLTPPAGAISAAAFLGSTIADAITARCEQLHKAGAGRLYRRGESEAVALKAIETPAKLQEELLAGAVWMDDPAASKPVRCALREWPAETASPRPAVWTASWSAPVLPPLAGKLYQESNLRPTPTRSRI